MYVIAGVSGNTGSVVAHALLEQGQKVRVLVRDVSKGDAWKARGAEVAVGSIDDEVALAKAFEGALGAYLLLPPDPGASDFIAQRLASANTMARAVSASRLPHFVFLSSIGGQHSAGTGIIESSHNAERVLGATSAKATFVRAAYFLENWGMVLGAAAQAKLPTFLPPDPPIPMVATKDIGLLAAKSLLAPPAGNSQIFELSGPRDYTSRDIGAVLASLYGRPVEVDAAPVEAVVPAFTSFGISPNVAALYRGLYAGIAKGVVAFDGRGHQVRGTTDAEAVLRGLGAGKR